MADESPTGAFEKKVVIALESTMSGVQDALRALESMQKHLDRVGASTKETDKAIAGLSRATSKASKDVAKLSSNFKSLKKVQKGMFETMRSIGSVTRTALGTATVAAGAFIAETKRIGDTMLQFQVSSLNAATSLKTLGDAYGSLKSQSNSALLSMQDMAASLTKFQKQGIAHMAATMQKGVISGWEGIMGSLAAVVGKTNADELMHEWVGSLGDEFEFLRKTIARDLGPIAKKIQETADPDIKARYIDQAISSLETLRKRTGDLGGITQQVIGHFSTLKDVALGIASPLITGTVAINNAMIKIGTTLENVSTRLVATFGPEIETVVKGLGDWLDKNVTRVIDKLIDKAKELHTRFEAWGGTKQLLESLTRALDYVWRTISKITVAGLSFIEWITNANAATQVLAAGLASLVLAPGLLPGVVTLMTGLGGISKAAYGAAAAMRTMSLAQAAAQAKMFAGRLGVVGLAATAGHLGGKALGGFDTGTFGDALSGAAGAAVAGAMVGSVIPVIGTAVGAAIGGVGSLIVTAISSWGDDTEKALNKMQPEISDTVTKKWEQLQAKIDELNSKNLKQLAEATQKTGEEAEKTGDKFADFVLRIKDLDQLINRILPGFSQAVGGISAIIDTLGPATDQFGESISNLIKRTSMDEIVHGFESVQKYAKLAAEQIAQIDLARANNDIEGMEQHTRLLGLALANVEKATGNMKQGLEGALKPLEKQVELVSTIKELRQLDLDISQQLYGTPALAVQAQLELVKTMQVEKEVLQDQLALTQDLISQMKARGYTEKDIFFLRMKELDLSKKIKGVTRDQLAQVKELRDGYLSAVSAQALGAGKFSKVLVSQEQNLARGLLKGAVKPNFLMGQAGADASRNRADPYRFSAQGMGFLESMSGQIMSPDEISKAVYDRVANVSDPTARAAAQQGADAFMGIMDGASKNTKDLGGIFTLGMGTLGDRIVDAIGGFAEQRHMASVAGLGLRGPAGETFKGSMADLFSSGMKENVERLRKLQDQIEKAKAIGDDKAIPDLEAKSKDLFKKISSSADFAKFDPAAIRRQGEEQQASTHSVEALINWYEEASKKAKSGLDAPVRTDAVDPRAANTYFVKALPFLSTIANLMAETAKHAGIDVDIIQNILNPKKPTSGLEKVPIGMSSISVRGAGRTGLSADSKASRQLIDDLKRGDQEVKRHETAHQAAAGPYAQGSPSYEYKRGPDGRRYAIGGEVLVDISPVPGDPQATIDKMQKIRKAALAPRHPSEQDLAVAKQVSQMERHAKASIGPKIGIMALPEPSSVRVSSRIPGIDVPGIDTPETIGFDTHLSPMGLPLGAASSSIEITNLGKLVNVIGQSIKANRGNTSAIVRNINAQSDVSKTLKSGNFFKAINAELKATGQRLESAKTAFASTDKAFSEKLGEFMKARSAPGGQKPLYRLGETTPKGVRDSSGVVKLRSEVQALRRPRLSAQRSVNLLSKRQARVGRIKEVGRAARAAMPNDFRVRDIATNLKRIVPSIREGFKAAPETGRAYQAGQTVGSVPGKVVQAGKKVQQAGQTAVRSAGRAYEFVKEIKAADIGKGLKTGTQTTGRGIVTAGKVAGRGVAAGVKGVGGSLLRGVGSKFILTELAIASADATYQAKQLENEVEALPDRIARANQDKQGRDLGKRFERLIEVSETRTLRDEMVKQRQKLDSMMLGLKPALEKEGFQYQGQGGVGGIVPKFSMDLGLTGGVQEGTIKSIKKRRVAIQKDIDDYDKSIVDRYNAYVAELDKAVLSIQASAPDADISTFEKQFNDASANMTKFVGDLISNVQGESLEGIAISSNRLVQQGADKLLNELKSMTKIQIDLDTAPTDKKKEIEAELSKSGRRIGISADYLRTIGGGGAVDDAMERFNQHIYDVANREVFAITKQIDSLTQDVSPKNKGQIDELITKRANIQRDIGISDELSPDELNLLDPYIKGLKINLAAYADLVKESSIAGTDQKPELEKQITGLENHIADQMVNMGQIFGVDPAFKHISKALTESQDQANQILAGQNEVFERRIKEFEGLKTDAPTAYLPEIQANIDEIQSIRDTYSKALATEFGTIKDRASKLLQVMAPPGTKTEAGKGTEAGRPGGISRGLNVIEHLKEAVGEVDFGKLNLKELEKYQKIVDAIYQTHLKDAKVLQATGEMTDKDYQTINAGSAIVSRINDLHERRQAETEKRARGRNKILGEQQMVQEKMAKIQKPLGEADKLRAIQAEHAQGIEITPEKLKATVPKMVDIAELWKKATKRDEAKAPEREEGQTEEKYRKSKRQWRSQRETESQLAASEMEGTYGEDWNRFGANINNLIRSVMGEGTQIPGSLDRGLARLSKSMKTEKDKSTELQAAKERLDAKDKAAALPGATKELIQGLSPDIVGVAGGVGGALEALLKGDFSGIGEGYEEGSKEAKLIKDAMGPDSDKRQAKTIRDAVGMGGAARYERAEGGKAHPNLGGLPILTAVDTDELTKKKDMPGELREKYGRRAEPMIRSIGVIEDLEKRIKRLGQDIEGPTAAERGPYGVGQKDIHGFELPGTGETEGKRGRKRARAPMSVGRREKLKARKAALKELRKKKLASLGEMYERAEGAGNVKQSQAEKGRIEEEQRRLQAAAEGALGLGYTGDAPTHVEVDDEGKPVLKRKVTAEKGKKKAPWWAKPFINKLPPGVTLPSPSGPMEPGTVRGGARAIQPRVGVPRPTAIRQLTHGVGDGPKKAAEYLEMAAKIIRNIDLENQRGGDSGITRSMEYVQPSYV